MKEIATGIAIGAVLALGGMFFRYEKRITTIETKMDEIAKNFSSNMPAKTLAPEDSKSKSATKNNSSNISLRLIFTSGLDSENHPLDGIKQIKIGSKFYIYTNFYNLSLSEKYLQEWKITNQGGDLVYSNKLLIPHTQSNFDTYLPYTPKTGIDAPGRYTITIYINGEIIKEDYMDFK